MQPDPRIDDLKPEEQLNAPPTDDPSGAQPAQFYPPASALLARLRRHGHVTRKGLGQNFLIRESVLRRIVDLVEPDPQTLALEIGPGPATLTTLLAQSCGGVLAVERDESLRPFHAELFAPPAHASDSTRETDPVAPPDPRVEILYADALRVDLARLARERAAAWSLSRLVLAGNLPFQITSPLLFGQCAPGVPWERIVVMVQREVADRIAASPRSKDYGILTVKLAFWWEIRGMFGVPADAFRPRPKVDAAVLRLMPLPPADLPPADEWPRLSKFIDLAFQQRRKRLYNSPAAAWLGEGGRDRLRDGLVSLGLNPDARPEDLPPAAFRSLLSAAQ